SLFVGPDGRRVHGCCSRVAPFSSALEGYSGPRFQTGLFLYCTCDSSFRHESDQRDHRDICSGPSCGFDLLESCLRFGASRRARPVPGGCACVGNWTFSRRNHRICDKSSPRLRPAPRARRSSDSRQGKFGLELCTCPSARPARRWWIGRIVSPSDRKVECARASDYQTSLVQGIAQVELGGREIPSFFILEMNEVRFSPNRAAAP